MNTGWDIDPVTGDYKMVGGAPSNTSSLTLPAYYRLKISRQQWMYAPNDKYARPGRIERAGRTYQPTTAEIGYFLADWVRRTRSKSIDPIVIRDNWTGAYHFVAGPAIGQLNSYAKANDPFANAGTQAINVEIVSVLARSPSTYQVQWRETQFNAGTSGVTENWTGLFTAKINPPKNEAELRANPLGIFITAFQWSREL